MERIQWKNGAHNLDADIGDIITTNKFGNLNELPACFAITILTMLASLCA